jgi:hypothetical protein
VPRSVVGNGKRSPEEIKLLLCGVVNVQVTPVKSMTEIGETVIYRSVWAAFVLRHSRPSLIQTQELLF